VSKRQEVEGEDEAAAAWRVVEEKKLELVTVPASMLPGTIPVKDQGKWKSKEEPELDCKWSFQPWKQSSIACLGAAKDGNTTILKHTINKALTTAETGMTVVLGERKRP